MVKHIEQIRVRTDMGRIFFFDIVIGSQQRHIYKFIDKMHYLVATIHRRDTKNRCIPIS